MHREDLLLVVGRERELTRRQLVHDDAERVDVAPSVDVMSGALFGRHVRGRPQQIARARSRGDAEVAHLHELDCLALVVVALHEHDVRRLDVAVDDAACVRVPEPRRHLHRDVDDARQRERARAEQLLLELDALEEVHREVEQAVRLLPVVDDAHHVGMIELAHHEGLGVEARAELQVAAELLVQHLHCDGRAELLVTRAIHGAHPADADEALDQQLPGELATDEVLGRAAALDLDARVVAGEITRVVLRQRRGARARRAKARQRRRARRRRQRALGGWRPVGMQAQRKATFGRTAERLGQHEQRLGVVGRGHLEHVQRGVDRRVDEGDDAGGPRRRELLHHHARALVGQLGDENGEQRVDGVAHCPMLNCAHSVAQR